MTAWIRLPPTAHTILLMLLPTVVMITAALVLMSFRASTRVMLDLSVSRLTFTVGGSEAIPLRSPRCRFRP